MRKSLPRLGQANFLRDAPAFGGERSYALIQYQRIERDAPTVLRDKLIRFDKRLLVKVVKGKRSETALASKLRAVMGLVEVSAE